MQINLCKMSATREHRLEAVRAINEQRGVIFGPCDKYTKTEAWRSIHAKCVQLRLVPSNKDFTYTRDTFWHNIKKATRKKVETNRQRAEFGGNEIRLTEVDNLVLEIVRDKDTGNLPIPASHMSSSSNKDSYKEPKSVFQVVQACCVSLVRDHGYTSNLFSEKPFRDIINYLPMTSKQKRSLTAENIKKLVEKVDREEGDDDDDDDFDTARASDDDDEDDKKTTGGKFRSHVKAEAVSCTCNPSVGPEGLTHSEQCPAYAPPVYWSFYTVSVDEAACSLCSEVLTWTDISTLKEHLTNAHPTTRFYDDDEQFEKGPATVGPHEDTEQIFFNEDKTDQTSDRDRDETPPPRKKRKLRMPKILPHKNMTRAQLAKAVDRFKSLDIFGQYVASLMKLLPKGKCVQFQIQIVERLLRAQPAAG